MARTADAAAERTGRAASPATWDGAEPPALRPATWWETARGVLRIAAFVAMTATFLPLFLLGRLLRRWLGPRIDFHFRLATLWSRVTLRLAGLTRRVEGRPVRSGALVANHSSWLDIPAIRAGGLVWFVSKADVADWPGIGTIARAAGTVFIERRRVEAKRQEEMLRARIAARQRLAFFPEGTSTDGLRVLPFKSSLFSVFYEEDGGPADLEVQPVTVRYEPHPDAGLPPEVYGWWGRMPFGAHIWDVFTRSRGGRVSVTFHPPLHPADHPGRKALARAAQAAVAAGLERRR